MRSISPYDKSWTLCVPTDIVALITSEIIEQLENRLKVSIEIQTIFFGEPYFLTDMGRRKTLEDLSSPRKPLPFVSV